MLKIFLWLRYLGKRKVVGLSIAAVAISSALLIVVASLFNGFINAVEKSAAEAIGDAIISPYGNITDYKELTKELEGLKPVEAATGTLMSQGLLHLGSGNVRAVDIWGIEVEKQGKVTGFGRALLKKTPSTTTFEGRQDSRPKTQDNLIESYVGIGVLEEPNELTDEYDFDKAKAAIGREVVITTGSVTTGKDGNNQYKRQTIRLVIADVVFTGAYYLDSRNVYIPIDKLQAAMASDSDKPLARQINIKFKEGADTESAMAQIRGVWKTFASQKLGWDENHIDMTMIETAVQMQARFMGEVRKQMGVLLLIFSVVSLSAVLLIFCIFYMIVETRRKDIAILKSCGATSGSVVIVFTGFGACIGIIGAAGGTLLGYLVTRNINTIEGWIRSVFGLKLWKSSVYMFSTIPNEVNWSAVWQIAVISIIAACIGALLPAIMAAMVKPVRVLRYE